MPQYLHIISYYFSYWQWNHKVYSICNFCTTFDHIGGAHGICVQVFSVHAYHGVVVWLPPLFKHELDI